MTPPTVNASYDPSMNGITFPAGILQPPFYDPNADDAMNYGGMGGLTIAYAAFEKSRTGKPRPPKIDGFTPEQRFFLGWAQVWRENARPESIRALVQTNEHAPAPFRVNGPLSNMPEFATAFGCKAGDPMVRPDSLRAQIW